MRGISKCFITTAICICVMLSQVEARDLKAGLPCLPLLAESNDKGILIDLLKAMAKEYKDGKISWGVYPSGRAMDFLEKGKVDFEIPMLVNPSISPDKLPFQFSTDVVFRAVFALYTNKNNKEINPKNVSKYKIESENAIKDFFGFHVSAAPDIEAGLKKVDMGRIDGYIIGMPEGDQALKKLGLKNIKRWEYGKYDAKIVLQKGPQGKEVNEILSGLIRKLKANGEYQKIMRPVLDQHFKEW